jgi:hypothetical protein
MAAAMETYGEDLLSRIRARKRREQTGMFSCETIIELVEIMSGRIRTTNPRRVELGDIILVRSSRGDGYYRTTEDSCTCKGWHFSQQKYGVGKCRHHTEAWPEAAAVHEASLEAIRGPKKLAKPPVEPMESIRPKGKWPGGHNGPVEEMPFERKQKTEA